MPAPTLRLVNPDGSLGKVLTDWSTVQVGGDEGEPMVLELAVPTDSAQFDWLADQVKVALLLDDIEPPDCRFTLDETNSDEITADEDGTWKGSSLLFRFNYAEVYPASYPNLTVPGVQLADHTPGKALRQLVEAAQARGWWPELVLSFTDTHDSAGQPWTSNLDDFLDMGRRYLDIVTQWAQRKVAVARVLGANTLQLYQYGNHGDDLSATVQLLPDYQVYEGPVSQSWRDTVTTMLAVTDTEGVSAVERTDAAAFAKYGRREGFLSQSQVVNVSVLQDIADGTLALTARSRDSFTYGLQDTQKHLPLIDWDRGDVVEVRTRSGDRVLRARQLTVAWAPDGSWSGSVSFGAKLKTTAEAIQERIEQLTSTSMDQGAYQAPIVGGGFVYTTGGGSGGDPGARDTVPPGPPTSLQATNVQYTFVNGGFLGAIATMTWVSPTTSADGSALTDLSHYEVQWKEHDAAIWNPSGTVGAGTQTTTLTLSPNTQYDVRVRAVDVWLNRSSWTTITFTTVAEAVPPAQPPSTPTVVAQLFSALKVSWNGKDSSGNAFETDVRFAEVHLSTTSGFTPTSGTYVATLNRPTQGVAETLLTGLTPGTTYYVKLRALDAWGNVGPASAQASGVPVDVFSNVASEFADFGNLVPDGSFERPETRASLLASQTDLLQSTDGVNWTSGGGWSFTQNTGQHVLLDIASTAVGQWTQRFGTSPTGADTDGVYKDGGTVAQWSSAADVAFDPTKLYRGSVRIRVDRNATNSPPKVTTVSFEPRNNSSQLLNPTTGATSTDYGTVRAELADNAVQTLADGWRTWEGWASGTALPAGDVSATVTDPQKMPTGTTKLGLNVVLDVPDGNGKWHVGRAQITGVPVSWHGDYALQVAGSATTYRRAILARLEAQGGSEQWYARFRCRLTGPSSPVPLVTAGVRLIATDGSTIPTSAGPGFSAFVKDGWMTVEGRIARDTSAKFQVAANAELFVQVQGMASGQTMSFDGVEFRQVATNVLIADAAIDSAKVQSLSASKITAGTLSAVITLSGEFRTADTGARTIINSSGVKLYNGTGDNTVSLNSADGSASFSGTIGSVDIVGYARVLNPVTFAQMYMHPGTTQYPFLAASVGYAAERGPGTLSLSGGQLNQDMIWQLRTPAVAYQNEANPTVNYEEGRLAVGILTNAILASSDPGQWPTKIGGYVRMSVGYGTKTVPSGYTLRGRPFWEFLHDYRTPTAPLTQGDDLGAYTGFQWQNKYGQNVAIRISPFGPNLADSQMEFVKNNSGSFVECRSSAWLTSSHSSTKEDVEDVPFSALDVIAANPAKRWRYVGDERFRLGPMADNLPDEVAPRQADLDHSSAIGLLWRAVEELMAR